MERPACWQLTDHLEEFTSWHERKCIHAPGFRVLGSQWWPCDVSRLILSKCMLKEYAGQKRCFRWRQKRWHFQKIPWLKKSAMHLQLNACWKRDSLSGDLTSLSLWTKSTSKKTKDGRKYRRDERKHDWMNDTKDSPHFATAFLGASYLFSGGSLRTGLNYTRDFGMSSWSYVCLSASHFVPTVRFWKSNLTSKSKFPCAHPAIPGPIPGMFEQVCRTDVQQPSHDSVPQLRMSLHPVIWVL